MESEKEQSTATTSTDQEYIDELVHLLTLAKHPETTALLQGALEEAQNPSSQLAQDGESSTDQETADPESKPVESKVQSTTKSARPSRERTAFTAKISEYGWDQSDKYVKIYITSVSGLDQLTQENIHSSFKERSMAVELTGVKGRNYSLVISDFFSPIIPDQSSVKAKGGVVTINLRKAKREDWEFLTHREKKLKDAREMKPPKVNKDEDPGLGLMKLMKQMYDEGDDDMKRSIAKAWQESQDKKGANV